MEKLRTAYRLNLIIVFFVLISTLWMMSGITGGPLSAGKLAMFRFFTVDSNILMGIIALLAALEQRKVLKGRKERVCPATYVLLLTGTVGVTLTMLVTIFFLEPTMAPQFGLFGLFLLTVVSTTFLIACYGSPVAVVIVTAVLAAVLIRLVRLPCRRREQCLFRTAGSHPVHLAHQLGAVEAQPKKCIIIDTGDKI